MAGEVGNGVKKFTRIPAKYVNILLKKASF